MEKQPNDELGAAVEELRESTPVELHPLLDAILVDEAVLDRAWAQILDKALDEG